jgi:hypothetical protein
MGPMRNQHQIFIGKPEEKRPVGRWGNNIKIKFKKTGCNDVGFTHLVQVRNQFQGLVNFQAT